MRTFLNTLIPVSFLFLLAGCLGHHDSGVSLSFNDDWFFLRQDTAVSTGFNPESLKEEKWEKISLPHTPMTEPVPLNAAQWKGVCWYKKSFRPEKKLKGCQISLLFEGAMNDAIVYLNGVEIFHNTGGFLPFFVDITNDVKLGHENELLVKLDNRVSPFIASDKHTKESDFYYYGGLYRNVKMFVKNKLHITEAVEIDSINGGGIMTGFRNISSESATVITSALIQNSDKTLRSFSFQTTLLDGAGTVVAKSIKNGIELMPGTTVRIPMEMKVTRPALWAPDHPFLYTLKSEITEGNNTTDRSETRIGIHYLKISYDEGVVLNGEKIKIRGTNRLQEYPYIGNALSDNANYRDAYKIKEAGFNFVRCCHYPPSPAFLDACDEMGIMVMESVPDWHFRGDSASSQTVINNVRLMCRRDRNHPSIIIWELSPEETMMPFRYLSSLKKAAQSEMPLSGCFTSCRLDTICDIYTPGRQQIRASYSQNVLKTKKALFFYEYDSGENYSPDSDARLKKSYAADLKTAKDRYLNESVEMAMLSQAIGFQVTHNSNLESAAIGDANWLMFDFNNQTDRKTEKAGVMDIFRSPKFSYWFFRSQSDESPVCFIASYNTIHSGKSVKVFSNADSVLLFRNDTLIAAQPPDKTEDAALLDHPPFTFKINRFAAGTLKAVGRKDGFDYASCSVTTPGKPHAIRLSADFSNKPLAADGSDAIFVYASVVDSLDNPVFNATDTIEFQIKGEAEITGEKIVRAKSGIAPVLIKAKNTPGKITLKAKARNLSEAEIMIESKKQ